jgi:hypothetical protein
VLEWISKPPVAVNNNGAAHDAKSIFAAGAWGGEVNPELFLKPAS